MSWSADIPVRILGTGQSGQAARALALSKGHDVQLFDEKNGDDPFSDELGPSLDAPFWIVSPGFDYHHPWMSRLRASGAEVIPELEFGASFLEGDIIAVTGSLGKTSMVLLLAELLKKLGYSVTISGNSGIPVSQVALESPYADFHLIEASSFQLESINQFRPDRAVCLNLYPNHLDRHGDMKTYAEAKARLFSNMTSEDCAAWPEDFPIEVETSAQRVFADQDTLPEVKGSMFVSGPLRENLAMSLSVLQKLPGLTPDLIEKTIREFQFPDHRMQEVDIPGMGRVIDDSKSTCYIATRAALNLLDGRVHLLMGGQDKDQDPEELRETLQQKNPFLYLFGASGKKMQKAWQDSVDVCILKDSLEDLMKPLCEHRTDLTLPVLLSPGCASYDQFDGFASRGAAFQTYMRQLANSSSETPTFNPRMP